MPSGWARREKVTRFPPKDAVDLDNSHFNILGFLFSKYRWFYFYITDKPLFKLVTPQVFFHISAELSYNPTKLSAGPCALCIPPVTVPQSPVSSRYSAPEGWDCVFCILASQPGDISWLGAQTARRKDSSNPNSSALGTPHFTSISIYDRYCKCLFTHPPHCTHRQRHKLGVLRSPFVVLTIVFPKLTRWMLDLQLVLKTLF